MGLNFELGKPGELEKHKETFTRSLEQLSGSGGLISIINHPCTLVLEEWFSTNMKSRELTEAGYKHFEEFVKWAIAHANVKTTCASELRKLYPDRALGRLFSPDEIQALAVSLSNEINFQRVGDVSVSAAEAFGMLVNCLCTYVSHSKMPQEVPCKPVHQPTKRPASVLRSASVPWAAFCDSLQSVTTYLNANEAVPNHVQFAQGGIAPEDYLGAVASALTQLMKGETPPNTVRIEPMTCRFEGYVDEEAGRSAWKSVMMPPNFTAPKLIELAKVEAWTLKPAILKD
jgi:hypothetical protein